MRILVYMHHELGHLIPGLAFASSLARHGHEMVVLSTLDMESLIRDRGFRFVSVHEESSPRGTAARLELMDAETRLLAEEEVVGSRWYELFRGELDGSIRDVAPDLV